MTGYGKEVRTLSQTVLSSLEDYDECSEQELFEILQPLSKRPRHIDM